MAFGLESRRWEVADLILVQYRRAVECVADTDAHTDRLLLNVKREYQCNYSYVLVVNNREGLCHCTSVECRDGIARRWVQRDLERLERIREWNSGWHVVSEINTSPLSH